MVTLSKFDQRNDCHEKWPVSQSECLFYDKKIHTHTRWNITKIHWKVNENVRRAHASFQNITKSSMVNSFDCLTCDNMDHKYKYNIHIWLESNLKVTSEHHLPVMSVCPSVNPFKPKCICSFEILCICGWAIHRTGGQFLMTISILHTVAIS